MKSRLISRELLDVPTSEAMYRLLDANFIGVSHEQFLNDLLEKNWVVLLEDAEHRIVGYSTLHLYPTRSSGDPIWIAFSGDTIVHRDYWGSFELPVAWIGSILKLQRTYLAHPLYWFLISSGYRTYRFLPVFFRHFHPRHGESGDPRLAALASRIASDRFGNLFDASRGIIKFPNGQMLRPELGGIPKSRLSDPHVRFFATANPGHEYGDELVCLTEISEANMTPAGLRVTGAARRRMNKM